MTLRDAYDLHYLKDRLSPRTVSRFKHDLTFWERFSGNPDVSAITAETLLNWQRAAIAAGLSPHTVNTVWRNVRSILYRIGPPIYRNPQGLSIIAAVPYLRPLRVIRPVPPRIHLEDLSKVYVACARMTTPKTGLPAVDWWRAVLVLAYFTGLRRSDLFGIRIGDIDLDRQELRFRAQKTGKPAVWYLHPAACAHISRIWQPDPDAYLFRKGFSRGGRMSAAWKLLTSRAGVPDERYFTLHDIRKTAASEIDRVDRGIGKVFLQHAPRNVSEVHYLNAAEELRDAIDKMRVPVGFNCGPKMQERSAAKQRQEAIRLNPRDFTPFVLNPDEWGFRPGAFGFRGKWYQMTGLKLAALRALVSSPTGVAKRTLLLAVYGEEEDSRPTPIAVTLDALRDALRGCFGLPEEWNPVPCIDRSRGHAGQTAWTVWLPADLNRERDAG